MVSSLAGPTTLTESELRVPVDDIVAADVDQLHPVGVQHRQRRVHVVDLVNAHASALAFLLTEKVDFLLGKTI